MQQVFTVMNSLLKSNQSAKQRKLYVRTYKVVPLTQRSGVLQWCENTLPLSCILTGDGTSRQPGLHVKYFPNDYAPNDCRRRLHASILFLNISFTHTVLRYESNKRYIIIGR
jgi:ataxia telangiectasia mutated family protein